ncbi:monocarboxylate transporter 9-like isoform X1 [Dermacentor andersoni]|uniref:monocarboxylate transporter 9-like isoform X1 n=1 Tax=Dermacentor andersoni TaxID=34620 RepID=UPI003B3A9221
MDRSWGVAGAASLTAFFTVVMMMNSGFFYVSFIEEFGVDREAASWPASVMSIVSHSSGLLVSCAQRHLSVFQLGVIGSVFLWAGILGAVFAPNMAWMTVTLGAIHGAGVGIVCVTLVIVVMMYFDKYRGVASGLKFAGYTLASLLFPTILTSLKDAYGFRGSMLVYAAITMNVTALTLLLKEPPWEMNARNRKTETSKEESGSVSSITAAPLDSAASNALAFREGAGSNGAGFAESINPVSSLTPNGVGAVDSIHNRVANSEVPVTHACNSSNEQPPENSNNVNLFKTWLQSFKFLRKQESTSQTAGVENGSNGKRTATIMSENKASNITNQRTSQKSQRSCSLFREVGNLLSKPRFYACVLAVVAMDYTMAVFPATIVDYALDKGSSRSHADLSVTYCSPAELFGRIVLPLIGDCKFVSRTTLVSASFFLLAATMLAIPATPSFLSYILVCACATMFTACLLAMKPVVIADYFGIESIATSWGFAGVTLLPLLLCSPYIIGYFRDTGGSYDGLYQLQAGIHCFVGGLFGLLAVLDRRRQKKWTKNLID